MTGKFDLPAALRDHITTVGRSVKEYPDAAASQIGRLLAVELNARAPSEAVAKTWAEGIFHLTAFLGNVTSRSTTPWAGGQMAMLHAQSVAAWYIYTGTDPK